MMIDLYPNETLLYQWLIFIAAVVVLNWGVFRPVFRLLAERKRRTDGDEQRAALFETKIAELSQKVEASLGQARHEGQAIIQSLRQEAEATAGKTMVLARERMESELRQMRAALEKESRAAELQLKQHARELAGELSERVLERPLA